MRRPLGLSAAGWYLVVSEVIPLLLLLLPAAPPSPQLAALAASLPPDGRFADALWWIDSVVTITAAVLVLRGVRAGRTLYLAWGALLLVHLAWTLQGQTGATEVAALQAWPFALAGALLHVAIYLAIAALLLRRPSRDWLALPPDQRSFPVWSVRGVLGTVLLVAAGFALYGWLLACLILVAVAIGQALKPVAIVVLVVPTILVAVLLPLGLAVAPGRHGTRRLALVGLCSGLFTLLVGVIVGSFLCSPVAASLVTGVQVPPGFGRHLLLACPVLLVLLVPCALRLRRPLPADVTVPG